jgi:hypothetical protein
MAVVEERKVEHSGPALAQFIEGLLRLCSGAAERVAIGIEVPVAGGQELGGAWFPRLCA